MWPALRLVPPTEPPAATVRVPGSKSSAARCLIAAALADGRSTISNLPRNADISALIGGLRALGVSISLGGDAAEVEGQGGRLLSQGGIITVGQSGTALRFLAPLAALSTGATIVLDGDARLRERPVGPLVEALRALGGAIEYRGEPGAAPFAVTPRGGLSGGEVDIDAGVSSQFISALLLAGPLFEGGLTVRLCGKPVSAAYIDLTIEHMSRCGVNVRKIASSDGIAYRVDRGSYRAGAYSVPPDASTASYFWSIGAVTDGEVTVADIEASSKEPDMSVATALAAMGCGLQGGRGITVRGRGGLRPIRIDAQRFPDGALTLAAAAACAPGESEIRGLSTLNLKESPRLEALVELITSLGGEAAAGPDALTVRGGALRGGVVRTRGDHRLAMAAAVIGSKVPGVIVEAPHVVKKSCPQFWALLRGCGVRSVWTARPLVSLIGFMGAGKSTVGAELSRELGVPLLELDELIVERSGRESAAAIFDLDGEEHFRNLEHQTLVLALETVGRRGGVISTGGGLIEREENRQALLARTTVVYLEAGWGTIEARLAGDTTRPLWRDSAAAKARFEARRPWYEAAADLRVQTDKLTVRDVCAVVRELWCEGVEYDQCAP